MVALIVCTLVLMALSVDYFLQRAHSRTLGLNGGDPACSTAPWTGAVVPPAVFIGDGHTWASLLPTGAARIGADGLAASLLGGVDTVDLSAPGTPVQRGQVVATLHRGSRSIVVRAPLSGKVTAINEAVLAGGDELTVDPYGRGWLLAVKPEQAGAALREMRIADEATPWLQREVARLRDLLVSLSPQPAGATLPDGGLPFSGVATRLDDGAFQKLVDGFFAPAAPKR